MGTKTKPDATSELQLIMGEVYASVEIEQITAGRGPGT